MGAPLLCRETQGIGGSGRELLVDAYQENPGKVLEFKWGWNRGICDVGGERSHQDSLIRDRVIGADDARRRYSAGKTDRWFGNRDGQGQRR